MPCNFRIPEACTIRNCFQGQVDFAAFITSCLQCLTSIFPGSFFFNPCRDHLLWGTSFDSSLVCESWPCLCHCFHLSFSASVVMQNREIVHGLSLSPSLPVSSIFISLLSASTEPSTHGFNACVLMEGQTRGCVSECLGCSGSHLDGGEAFSDCFLHALLASHRKGHRYSFELLWDSRKCYLDRFHPALCLA